MWALQEFSARNCESIPLRGISCASGERLAALAFRLRRTLAPSALVLALRARFFSRLRRSYLGQLPRIESLTKTMPHEKKSTFQSGGWVYSFLLICDSQNQGNDLPHQKLVKKLSFQPVLEVSCLKHTQNYFFSAMTPHVTREKSGKLPPPQKKIDKNLKLLQNLHKYCKLFQNHHQ